MRGLLINEKERQELQYILKRELEEILLDYEDGRIDGTVKKTMEEKYQLVLSLYRRISSQTEFNFTAKKSLTSKREGAFSTSESGR